MPIKRRRSKKRNKLAKWPVKIRVKKKQHRGREEGVSPLVEKYWLQRYDLFSKYDEGIQMDEEGWFSVTPEEIAVGHAWRCCGHVVIDCFAGVGGNAIQFAKLCNHVVAIDIDPQKVELAYNNAKSNHVVEDHIDFIVGDFVQLAPGHKGDVVSLSPPWGGPSYKAIENFTLDFLKPKDGYVYCFYGLASQLVEWMVETFWAFLFSSFLLWLKSLKTGECYEGSKRKDFVLLHTWKNWRHSIFQVAQAITPNIIMYLPRNIDLQQVDELSWLSSPPLPFKIEENYVNGSLKAVTAYFGRAADW